MSLKATRYALVAARQLRADIHLLHVVETKQFISSSLLSLSSVAGEEWNDRLAKRLGRLATSYKAGGQMHVLRPKIN